jgi:hypothetical protein
VKVAYSIQAPAAVVMVRPHAFRSNPDTLVDNAFQKIAAESANASIASTAYAEVSTMVEQLRSAGVVVHLFEDRSTETPDSVFPNNWFSTHAGGHIAIYPMASPSRQHERRWDVIDALKHHYRVQDVIDYSGLEQDHIYLEGTGAMVLDHIDRVAYVARSNRSDPLALERFCTHFNYEPLLFNAADASGRAIYHTNVLMCIGTDFAIACLDMVSEAQRRNEVRQRLMESGRSLIELTQWQVGEFCGNALELEGSNGRLLALSSRALRALTPAQTAALESSVTLLPLDVPTIELAGGSVRCMLAGVHLKPRRSLAGVS